MELKFSRARFDAGEMPTRTRGGLRVLKVVDSGLAVRYPIAAWIAGDDYDDCIGPRRYSRDGRYDGPVFDSPFDLVHEPRKVRVGLRRNSKTVSGFLPTANPDRIDLWREQGILVAEVEVDVGEEA